VPCPSKAGFLHPLDALLLGRGIVQRPHHQSAAAVGAALTAQRHQSDGLDFTGLEAERRARRHVQAHPVSRLAVEHQSSIHLEEMKMRADLDRPVARVIHRNRDALPIRVQLDGSAVQKIFAGYHIWSP
jgi:hypothetical protein